MATVNIFNTQGVEMSTNPGLPRNWDTTHDSTTGGSLGTSTAALYVAGYTTDFVAIAEEWSGVSWAEVADLSTARGYGLAGGGTTTAGFVAGGQTAPGSPNVSGLTEEWSGSSSTTKTIDTD